MNFEKISNIFKRNKKDKIDGTVEYYKSLTPTKDADKEGVYANALKYALENKEIKNIAIAGIYGSGKSSVIKSFFEKNENKKAYKPIYVSLGAFNQGIEFEKVKENHIKGEEKSETNGEEKEFDVNNDPLSLQQNEFYRAIEKSVLQQIMYQAEEKQLPLSRFKRLSKHSKGLLIACTIWILLTIYTIILWNNPNFEEDVTTKYQLLKTYINSIIINIGGGLFLLALACVIYRILFLLIYKFNLSRLRFKDAEIEVSNKGESIFNQYLDEIIYFFEATDYNVVVIEDLDRYTGNVSQVFQKLRELNTLINSTKQIKQHIDFIYAIRDDFFLDSEERTKFFDYIIPIIPISSSANSNEKIWNRLSIANLNDLNGLNKDFIDEVSIHIESQRVIDNIVNEYIIYKNNLNNDYMDAKQLFAIIMYKNLYPDRFSSLQKKEGELFNIFENKAKYINDLTEKFKIRIKEKSAEKEKVFEEDIKSIEELKYLLISTLYNYDSYYNVRRTFKLDGKVIEINKFISNEIGYEDIEHSDINFTTALDNYSSKTLEEKDVFKYFGNKTLFLKRWEYIEKGKENKLQILQREIDALNEKVQRINKSSFEELINEYGLESIFSNLTTLEKFLLSNGYITEEYGNYIMVFVEGNLLKKDYDFITAIKNKRKLAYDFGLSKVENVEKRLKEKDYEFIGILNFDLLYFLLQAKDNRKLLKIIELLDRENEEIINFVDGFLNRKDLNANLYEEFIKILTENSKTLWGKIYFRNGDNEYLDKWMINFLKHEKSLKNVNESFKEYVENHKTINELVLSEDINIIISSLKFLKIKLKNVSTSNNTKFLKEIFEKELYELNDNMLKLMLDINGIDFRNFENKNLTLILGNETLKKYVLENFAEYFDNCYTLHKSDSDDESVILEILNNSSIDNQTKEEIIKNGSFNEYIVKNINEDLYEIVLQENKMKVLYENILEIFNQNQELPENLINHVSLNIKKYKSMDVEKCVETFDKELIENFKQKYLTNSNVTQRDFESMLLVFKTKIEDINFLDISKTEFAVKENLVEFNEINSTYILENVESVFAKYIVNNIESYLNDTDIVDISGFEDEILFDEELSQENKKAICDNLNVCELQDRTCLYLINNNIVEIDMELAEKIFGSEEIAFDEKIVILEKVLDIFSKKEEILKFIELLKVDCTKFDFMKNRCQLPYNDENMKVCSVLQSKGIISSFTKGKHNNIIINNRKSEE